LTGIEFSRPVSLKGILDTLNSHKPNYSDLGLVISDGGLIDQYAVREITFSWAGTSHKLSVTQAILEK
jgi:hypothetical protein